MSWIIGIYACSAAVTIPWAAGIVRKSPWSRDRDRLRIHRGLAMSKRFFGTVLTLAVGTWLILGTDSRADQPGAKEPAVADLSLEVGALQTLYALNATRAQMVEL